VSGRSRRKLVGERPKAKGGGRRAVLRRTDWTEEARDRKKKERENVFSKISKKGYESEVEKKKIRSTLG